MLRPRTTTRAKSRRAACTIAGLVTVALALAGCGESVAAGGENAAKHPASGIWESNTVGGNPISGQPSAHVPLTLPPSQAPSSSPGRSVQVLGAVRQALGNGGCWEDAHLGNYYGAYDQWFWWMGQCNDTVAMASVELYSSAGAAAHAAHHASDTAVLARYRAGAVLVDVYGNAPSSVVAALSHVQGLKPVPGYGFAS